MVRADRPPRPMGAAVGRRSAAWARLALLTLAVGLLVPLVAAGLRSVLWALLGIAGLALAAVGLWWTLARSGTVRVLGAVLCVVAPLTVLALYAVGGMLLPAALSMALWVLAVGAARAALAPERAGRGHGPVPAPPPGRPWALMNPRSGGGKVDRFRLVDRAREAGVRVVLLGAGHQDAAGLAEDAVRDGADLLAVAGGDGTQALVAEVAFRHGVPFMVIPAGTRNHFALDLGLDREDPAKALHALTDGVELRVDLGFAAGRVFVNNASFGTYAAVVGDPAYREEKTRTALRTLPGLLSGPSAPRLRMRADGTRADGLQALLVSNNPYLRAVDAAHPGRRERLDSGRLGVLGVRVDSAVRAAGTVRGPHAAGLLRLTAEEVVVEADTPTVPAGVDGEHVLLPAPVVCRIVPGALRVRVPRRRVGTRWGGAAPDWLRVAGLALGRRATAPDAVRGRGRRDDGP
ncbi:diacylglycerol kinase family protein [Streptomyces sp. Tu 3180]|uniref:diacylglycerol/lipid kinase family protein n=1 Tax=Streptomyces sp. Tu 3180 TaxID=2682611 RepID=UPI001FB6563A|nr:diacylglycerol kinase family protein [Streptomyces sp. Tu 3180]